jgi:plasmid stabilization system protein ParE
MNKLELLDIAKSEFRDAIRWYRVQSPDVARRFALEIRAAVTAIREHPTRYLRWDKKYRYYIVNSFSYYLPYRMSGRSIIIVAVFHTSRDPAAWTGR